MAIFLKARWENLIMANYGVTPELLQPYLPAGTELDIFYNKAWISLVGFMFKNTKLFSIPIPVIGTFEEINLRFYVIRKEEGKIKRGVVFINETIPNKAIAWVANKLYKEHYTAIPTKSEIMCNGVKKQLCYHWKIGDKWNFLSATTGVVKTEMQANGFEEFIFEHYFGYTKINENTTEEYRVNHPRWQINEVLDYNINCDFEMMYGTNFKFLSNTNPVNVFVAEGSEVSVDWKRRQV